MRFFKHLLLIVGLFASVQANAQKDIIFSQYQMSPLTLNPALAGAYEGTYRVGAMRRNQWDVIDPTFGTTLAFVDAPLIMVGKRNWIGAGVMYYKDKAGDKQFAGESTKGGGITQSQTSLSAAFHYALDKKYKNIFTFGLKIGGSGITYDNNGETFTQLSGGAKLTDVKKKNFVDFGAGVMLKSKIDKKSTFSAGLSIDHINKPNISLISTTSRVPLNALTTVHLDYSRDLNKKLSLMPSLLYRQVSGSKDLTLQALFGYKLDPTKRPDLILKGGVGYRTGVGSNNYNNLEILLGADYKTFRFSFAYDLPRADLKIPVNSSMELGLHYTGKIYKKPVTKGAHFCPKY
jgi:type IX secretion system PorP/SprF family membrane protein